MTNKQIKEDFIQALQNRDVYLKPVSNIQFVTRCPYCGDTDKRENDGHFYIRVNPDDEFPIVYNCFLCPAGGVLTDETLSLLEIENINLKSGIVSLNKTAKRVDKKGIVDDTSFQTFEYKLPDITIGDKTSYIENRLGKHFTSTDFKRMKVITSLREFLIKNKIAEITCSKEIAFRYEKNYVGFLTHGNSHILFRDITEKEKIPWIKYPITEKSNSNKVFYSMESEIDIFTNEKITINIAEGVFDILSVCYNLGYNEKNTLNLCVSGKYYDTILLFLISLGFVGSNIIVNIFSDNDQMYNKKDYSKKRVKSKYRKTEPGESTSIEHYRKLLKNYKYLYGEVNVYYNLERKDYGIPVEYISLKRIKL